MVFPSREIGNRTFQGEGAPVVLRATRRAGKNNRSRVVALLFVSCAFNPGTIFATVPQQAPTSSDLLMQGRNLLEAGKLAEAELVLDRAAELAPSDSVILTLDGRVKGRLGEYASAVELLERVTKLTPQSAPSHVDLAIALADSGDLNSAVAETGTAIALAPRLAIAHLNRARILSDMKKDLEARDEFAIAVRLDSGNPDGYFYWSIAERTQGNFTEETELLRKVVKLEPGNVKAHIMLATSLLDQNRTAEAVSELRAALAIDPNSAQAIYKLSRALYPTNPEESKRLRDHFDRLKVQNAFLERAKALGNQAFHAFTMQDWRESIRLYTEGIETCGDCEIESALHRDLGLTFCRDGQIERGAEELRKALAIDPEDRDAAKALEMLRGPIKTRD
ncbi:MAG TPA: tetratricopeptide repeat protein [Terracidiphilus sp.]|jgi:Flp pilus assembly protein TadD